ncbi:MAG: hypothetical protein IKN66_02835, partial [Ruminococcus sp.]|nr:hypothetical protein [Ruminococcus sp.]
MENESAIITWISGWREANAISADAVLTDAQAKAFLSDLKNNFSFQTETAANTLIISSNDDAEFIAGITNRFKKGTFSVLNNDEAIVLINSDEFKTAMSAAVGEEWFDILYNGTVNDNTVTGIAFEGESAIRDFVYSGLIMNSSASEIVMVASPADDDHIYSSTLLSAAFANENIAKINGVEKNSLLEMSAFSIQYLGYSTDKAAELLVQYVEFISTGYTDNNLYTVGTNETSTEFWNRVYGSGLLENYRTLIEFKTDSDNLRADAIYFLGEYGDVISEDSVEKLTALIGCDLDTALKEYSVLQRMYPNGYEYRSEYIILCIDEVTSWEQEHNDDPVTPVVPTDDPTNDVVLPVQDPGGDNGTDPVEPGQNEDGSGGDPVEPGKPDDGNGGSNGNPSTGGSGSNSGKKPSIVGISMVSGGTLTPSPTTGGTTGGTNGGTSGGTSGGSAGGNTGGTPGGTSGGSSGGQGKFPIDIDDANRIHGLISLYVDGSDALADYNGVDGLPSGIGITLSIGGVVLSYWEAKAEGKSDQEAEDAACRELGKMGIGLVIDGAITLGTDGAVTSLSGLVGGGLGAAGLSGGWVVLGVLELGFLLDVTEDTFFDCIDAWVNGEDVNFLSKWGENFCDASVDVIKMLGIADIIDLLIDAEIIKFDPLILDLDNDGFNIIDKSEGAYFDKDNNGYRERIDWTRKDAFLTLDRNNNGRIDNGTELFGDTTFINVEDKYAQNGFSALKQYDENDDGVINSEDSVFGDLRLWVDANGDGISQASELSTLADHNIVSISATPDEETISTDTAAVIEGTSSFEYSDGTKGRMGALWATANLYDTKEIAEAAAEGFNFNNAGNMPSLAVALSADDGTLRGYIDSFRNAVSQDEKNEALNSILFTMSGAQNIAVGSRGANFDAKKLHVIETITGQPFVGANGPNPNPNAARILDQIYTRISDTYYSIFNTEIVKPYLDKLVSYEDNEGKQQIYTGFMRFDIMKELEEHPDSSVLNDICKHIMAYGKDKEINLNILLDLTTFFSYDRDLSGRLNKTLAAYNIYAGTGASDNISGTASDDTLFGGIGNDMLAGGAGDDTYVFARGFGNDTIHDYNGANTIKFAGLKSTDVHAAYDGSSYNAIITVNSTGETLTIKDFK